MRQDDRTRGRPIERTTGREDESITRANPTTLPIPIRTAFWLAIVAGAALAAPSARAEAFPLEIANEGDAFVELEWPESEGNPGELEAWVVRRRPLHGVWEVVAPRLEPARNDPGPFAWIDRDLDPRLYEYRVTEVRDFYGIQLEVESEVARADSDARVPAFVARVGEPIVIEAESWQSREAGIAGRSWVEDPSPPAGAQGAVLAALPDDTGFGCPSAPFAAACPRVDYLVDFPTSGVYTIWVRGFARSAEDEGILVGLDGVALERVATAWERDAWSWASGAVPGERIAIDVPTPGAHRVQLWMAEDGTRFDRFALAPDPDWHPTLATGTGGPGPPESARSARVFVTRLVHSGCSEPVVAECPSGYQLVGGGIDFPDKHQRCRAWDPDDEKFRDAHEKFFGFSSHPEIDSDGNLDGWYCRGESREVDCYAVCAHSESTGIASVTRAVRWIGNGERTVATPCDPGQTLIGGGHHSESFWEYPRKKEEFKVLGLYHDGDEWRCDDQSRDHYGFCSGICVPDTELSGVDLVETPTSVAFTAACPDGYRVVGGGFAFCDDQSCSASLDEIEGRPVLERGEYRCRVGFKDSGRGVVAPGCQATCMRDDLVTVPVALPEPGGPLALVAGIAGLSLLVRLRRGRGAPVG